MSSSMREVSFRTSDFDLFGQDLSPLDFEFFKKHTGAFKRMLIDQSKEKKQEFVDAFKEFSLHHGCLKDCPTKNDSRLTYLEEAAQFYKESFVNGKFSTAKNIVMDAVTLAQNKHLLQNVGAKSYTKDPFFHKETRDVFRRLFGSPSVEGTFIKVICVLPLHIKFGGSICRYLRRWLEAEPVKAVPQPTAELKKSSKQKNATSSGKGNSTKKEKEQAKPKEEQNHGELAKFQMYINEVFSQQAGPERMAQVKAAFESIGITDFVKAELNSTPDEKPSNNNEPAKVLDEGLSLAEHLGVNKNTTKGKNDDKSVSGHKYCKIPADIKPPSEEKEFDEVMACIHSEEFSNPMSFSLERTEDDRFSIMSESVNASAKLDIISDGSYEEIQKMLLLNLPHPNVQYEQKYGKLSKENELKLKRCKEHAEQLRAEHEPKYKVVMNCDHSDRKHADHPIIQDFLDNTVFEPNHKMKKRHACANCRKVEPEPKTFKKCQRCHGKRTKFYCSRRCQEVDWDSHREDHNSIEDVT